MTPKIEFIATHNWRSPLGFREALLNRFAEQTGWFQNFTTPARHVFSKLLLCGGGGGGGVVVVVEAKFRVQL